MSTMKSEKDVKAAVKKLLTAAGAYYFMPATHGYGASGVPDIVACLNGRFIGIECKFGTNKPTALQVKNLDGITQAGGIALVINEANLETLSDITNLGKYDFEYDFVGSTLNDAVLNAGEHYMGNNK
jgi:hypothetical protein